MAEDNWWESMLRMPSKKEYTRFMRGQRQQFTPMMRFLTRQAKRKTSDDPIVKGLARMMAAERSVEDIQGSYSGALGRVNEALKGADFGAMGRGVQGAVTGIGEALGVAGAGDVGTAAGRVSGIGDGRDVFSEAISGGVKSRFKELETQSLRDRADRLRELGLSKLEAEKAAQAERTSALERLADLRGQRRAAGNADPFARAMQFLQLAGGLRDYRNTGYGGGSYGAGRTGGTGDTGNGDTVNVTDPREIYKFITTGGSNEYLDMPGGGKLRPGYHGASRPAPGRR